MFANNSLACVKFQGGAWIGTDSVSNSSGYFSSTPNFTTAASARHLSASISQEEGLVSAFLFFEDIHNYITLLNGTLSIVPNSEDNFSSTFLPIIRWTWHDSSSKLRRWRTDNDDLRFGVPFTATVNKNVALYRARHQNGSYSGQALVSVFYDPRLEPQAGEFDSIHGQSSELTDSVGTETSDANFSSPFIEDSDLLVINPNSTLDCCSTVYAFWVNDTGLTLSTDMFKTLPSLPHSSFPFKRLAGTSLVNGTSFFIYHQLNSSTFAEDQWDNSLGGWVSNSFEISMV